MAAPHFTFQDICRINDHHWDNAYSVMIYHLEHNNLEKIIRGPEDIIYRNVNGMNDHQLEYEKIFLQTIQTIKSSPSPERPKRRRIVAEKVEIPPRNE